MNEAEIDRIAEEASQLSKTSQAAFISDACGGDKEAIEQVVRFLNFIPPDDFLTDDESIGLELVGKVIGKYRLIDQIGDGGSSIVYAANNNEGDGAEVALKLLRSELSDSQAVIARFKAEQEVLDRMRHPNIAAYVASGTYEHRPYFVMELVRDGIPVTEYCRSKELKLQERLRLFESICDAVIHAHQQGIIHRDIKPTNILIAKDQLTGNASAKLIDFGIAKALEAELSETMVKTSHGEFVGTRSYASPEQVSGLGSDTRTDVHALGLVLYEVLTGEPVIDVSTRPDADELKNKICAGEIPRPSENEQGVAGRKIPVALDWIVAMALAKKPERRYQSVEAMVADIRSFRQGRRVLAQPNSIIRNVISFVREHRSVTASMVLLCGSLAVSISLGIRAIHAENEAERQAESASRASREKSVALQRALTAEAETAKSLKTSERITTALFEVLAPPNERTLSEFEITHRERLRRASKEIGTTLGDDPLVHASVRWMLAYSFGQYGDIELALQEAQAAAQIFNRELGPKHKETLRADYLLADMLMRSGRLSEAETLASSVWERRRSMPGNEEACAEAMLLMSDIYSSLGRYEESVDLLDLIETPDKVADWTSIVESTKFRLAERCRDLGRIKESIQHFEELLKFQKKRLGDSDPSTLTTQKSLAALLLSVKRAEDAESLLQDALAKIKSSDPDHILVSAITLELAGASSWLGRKGDAERLLLETIWAQQRIRGSDRCGDPVTLCRYARLLRDRRAFIEAESIVRFAIDERTRDFPDSDLGVAACLETMASIHEDQFRYGEELYWKLRLLLAYARHYGWRHNITRGTATRALETVALYVGQLVTNGKTVIGIDAIRPTLKGLKKIEKKPLVVKNGDRFSLQWVSR